VSERVAIRTAFPFHLPDLEGTFFAERHDRGLLSFSRLVSAGTRAPTSKGTHRYGPVPVWTAKSHVKMLALAALVGRPSEFSGPPDTSTNMVRKQSMSETWKTYIHSTIITTSVLQTLRPMLLFSGYRR